MELLNIFRKKNSVKDPLGDDMLLQRVNAEILSDGRTLIEVKDNHRLVIISNDHIDTIDGPIITNAKKEVLPSVLAANKNLNCQCLFVNMELHRKDGVTPFFQIADPLIPTSIALSLHWNISYTLNIEQYIQTFNNSKVRLADIEENISTTINGHIRSVLGDLIEEAKIPVLQMSHYMSELQKCVEQYIRIELYEKYGLYVTSLFIDKINYNQNEAFYSLQAKMKERETDLYETKRQRDEDAYNIQRKRDEDEYTYKINIIHKNLELLQKEAELKLINDNIDAYTRKRELDAKEAEAKKSIYVDHSSTTNIYRTKHIYY